MAHANVVGVMSIATRQLRHMTDREVQLMLAIGAWAGTTIENARLHLQARRLAILEERERIGMDLHDGIIQSIYGVGLALDYARMELEENPNQAREKLGQSIEAAQQDHSRHPHLYPRSAPASVPQRRLAPGSAAVSRGVPGQFRQHRNPGDPENGLVNFPGSKCYRLVPYLPGSPR